MQFKSGSFILNFSPEISLAVKWCDFLCMCLVTENRSEQKPFAKLPYKKNSLFISKSNKIIPKQIKGYWIGNRLTCATLRHSSHNVITISLSESPKSKVKVKLLPWVTDASRWKLVFTNTANVWPLIFCATLSFGDSRKPWLTSSWWHDGRSWPLSRIPSWRSRGTGYVTSRSYRSLRVDIPLLTSASEIHTDVAVKN